MIVVAVMMYRGRAEQGAEDVACTRDNIGKVVGFGFGTGALSGFFGIGGGFLIVPALSVSTSMAIYRAVGTSLVAVSAFGLTTAANYAFSGLIDWPIAGAFIAGGILGSVIGTAASRSLASHKGWLNLLFAGLILVVALYMLVRSGIALAG